MALVKPLNIGRGIIPSYHRINGVSYDLQGKVGMINVALYMNRNAREENGMAIDFIQIPISHGDWKDGLTTPELYELVKKDARFADAFDENTPAPFKENFPELEVAEKAGVSPEYLQAEQDAKDQAAAEAAAEAGEPKEA